MTIRLWIGPYRSKMVSGHLDPRVSRHLGTKLWCQIVWTLQHQKYETFQQHTSTACDSEWERSKLLLTIHPSFCNPCSPLHIIANYLVHVLFLSGESEKNHQHMQLHLRNYCLTCSWTCYKLLNMNLFFSIPCSKKGTTANKLMVVTLSNLNRFSKFFCYLILYFKFSI